MSNRVIIEGCVGVGKTSVINEMCSLRPYLRSAPEPLERWESATLSDGTVKNYLQEYYDRNDETSFRRLQVNMPDLESM
jgi:deoxyadenosine/deoxycytidine kinase